MARRAALAAAAVIGIAWTGSVVRGAPSAGPGEPKLQFVKTVLTWHGNAAHLVWSDDGKTLFLANEEGRMSAVKIDTSNPMKPRIAATNDAGNFLWAADQRNGVLVFHSSVNEGTLRLDPRTFASLWNIKLGHSHAIATDGTRIFQPLEGNLGALVVLGTDGKELSRVAAPNAWPGVYGAVYDAATKRLYISVTRDPKDDTASTAGIYIYEVGGAAPAFRGRIPGTAGEVAVHGPRVWISRGDVLEVWNVANAQHPQQVGSWEAQVDRGPGGAPILMVPGAVAVNATGTRLYAAYTSVSARVGRGAPGSGAQVFPDAPAGFLIFDVSGSTPALITSEAWQYDGPYYMMPLAVALSPGGSTLAVSYWRYGVRLFGVARDSIVSLGRQATTGEAHDVYVDSRGIMYVFANDDVQIIDPQSGEHLDDVPLRGGGDGQWRPFGDGVVIVRGGPPLILTLRDAKVAAVDVVRRVPTYIWDNVFEDPFLFSGGEDGMLIVSRVTSAGDGQYTTRVVGRATVPRADGQPRGASQLLALAKAGDVIWALGPTIGVAAFDVSRPESPQRVFQDPFTFKENGNHVGLVVAHGRVYAGAGDHGVLIYDPQTFKRTGSIEGMNVNFLDVIRNDYLVVANYWYPQQPEGVYLYDLRANPDRPVFADRFPKPQGNANFRARVFGDRVYRVPLYGVDILQAP
ncbi:MAG TPA: hypothetical protein VKT83_10775 [bacterium]|nr:hypothetical protein [bacterium]